MSDETPAQADSPRPSRGKRALSALAGVLVLGLGAFLIANARADGALDARFVRLQEQLAERQSWEEARRSTVLGQPDNDLDAVPYYRGVEWLMGQRSEKPARPDAELPEDMAAVVAAAEPVGGFDSSTSGVLVREVRWGPGPAEEVDPETLASAKAAYDKAKSALRYVRRALRCGKANWKSQWGEGPYMEWPEFSNHRNAANFMVYEATLQDPQSAIQTGLEVVAYGQDLGRHGSPLGVMTGVAISNLGFCSLRQTLGRAGVTAEDCRRVVAALETYAPASQEELLAMKVFQTNLEGLEWSGRSLEPQAGVSRVAARLVGEGIFLPNLDLICEREIARHERYLRLGLGYPERSKALGLVVKDPDTSAWKTLKGSLAYARMARVVAAAHLYRLEHGTFPQRIADLGLPEEATQDPLGAEGELLGYRVEEGTLFCRFGSSPEFDFSKFETRAPE